MENININSIPKGQKVVIRQRPNGNTEIFLRPDLENGQMVFGEWSGWLLAIAFGSLVFLGLVVYSSFKAELANNDHQKLEQTNTEDYDTYTYGQ